MTCWIKKCFYLSVLKLLLISFIGRPQVTGKNKILFKIYFPHSMHNFINPLFYLIKCLYLSIRLCFANFHQFFPQDLGTPWKLLPVFNTSEYHHPNCHPSKKQKTACIIILFFFTSSSFSIFILFIAHPSHKWAQSREHLKSTSFNQAYLIKYMHLIYIIYFL